MMVQLAMYKGKGQIGNAVIRVWTKSEYSHCELVVNGWCYSASVMDKGVRRKAVGTDPDQINLNSDNWDVFTLPWADAQAVLAHFEKTDHLKYGWPTLVASQVFNRGQSTPGVAFCSEWAGDSLGFPCAASLSPGTLLKWANARTVWLSYPALIVANPSVA